MPKAITEGILEIGDLKLPCAVLDDPDKTRVLSQNGFLKAIGRHPFAPGGTGSAIDDSAPFLRSKNLEPFISEDLRRSSTPLLYLPRNPTAGAGGIGYGYRGTLLPDVCWVYQDAMTAGKLLPSQMHIGEAARAFLKALTNQAINDLIDRATGYDKLRTECQSLRYWKSLLRRFCSHTSEPFQVRITSTSTGSTTGITIQSRQSGRASLDIGRMTSSTPVLRQQFLKN